MRSSIAPSDSFDHTKSKITMSQGMRKLLKLRQELEKEGATLQEQQRVVHSINVSQPYVRPGSRQGLREPPRGSRGPVRNTYPGLVRNEQGYKNFSAAGARMETRKSRNAARLPDRLQRTLVDKTLDKLKEEYFPPSRGWSLRNESDQTTDPMKVRRTSRGSGLIYQGQGSTWRNRNSNESRQLTMLVPFRPHTIV